RFPFVDVGRKVSPAGLVPYVGADYRAATMDVVELLVGLGHRGIGLIGELSGREANLDRAEGYRLASTAAGLRPVLIEGAGIAGAQALELIRHNRLTAVVTDSSGLAEHLLDAATAAGLRVPTDLSIAQLGDPERSTGRQIDWTGFRIPREHMGEQAVALLSRLIAGSDSSDELQTLLPCELARGATVAPVGGFEPPTFGSSASR
ncbi:MAG: LacI family transcriptional regulator, partial [Propionibacteriaceae bacterium]|nr:LacI family transcriptional regulator [Propionibacteriaceae bacterium]